MTGERDERGKAYADAGLQARFTSADLAAKLARVKELDRATDDAFARWNNVSGTKLGSLTDAMQECNDAVIGYDGSVSPFPSGMLNGLPAKINLDSHGVRDRRAGDSCALQANAMSHVDAGRT